MSLVFSEGTGWALSQNRRRCPRSRLMAERWVVSAIDAFLCMFFWCSCYYNNYWKLHSEFFIVLFGACWFYIAMRELGVTGLAQWLSLASLNTVVAYIILTWNEELWTPEYPTCSSFDKNLEGACRIKYKYAYINIQYILYIVTCKMIILYILEWGFS